MSQKLKRKKRESLRGWWKVLPFLACPLMLLMTFAHWEAGRIQNQYQRSKQLETIRELRKEIGYLRNSDRNLNRIEVMDKKAPGWGLAEPDPDQRVIVPNERITKALSSIREYQRNRPNETLPTRTVLLHITYEDDVFAEETDDIRAEEPERYNQEEMVHEAEETD